eukprot:m.17078 g.17078  ORF g.17078 m.17078 type:complete len:59 (-) comp5893_c0_seq2:625-801(-)
MPGWHMCCRQDGVSLSECSNMCIPYRQQYVCDRVSIKCRNVRTGEKGTSLDDCQVQSF